MNDTTDHGMDANCDYWRGQHIRLRGITSEDGAIFYRWNQDSEMARRLDRIWFPASQEAIQRWASQQAIQRPEGDELSWVIENDQGEFVGSINTHSVDRRTGTFSYGVAVRSEYQRRGYAREAIELVLRYFFDELRYQKVTVTIHSDNESSIGLHERLGFNCEGCLRRMVYTRGHYYDALYYGLTVEEFRARSASSEGGR